MNKIPAVALVAVLALSACGSSTDAELDADAAAASEATDVAEAPVTLPPPTTEKAAPTTVAPPTTAAPTTAAPTTTAPPVVKGTRTNPWDLNAGDELFIDGTYAALSFSNMRNVDPSVMVQANRFNDAVPPGFNLVALDVTATIDPNYEGSYSTINLFWDTELVGAKGIVYEAKGLASGDDPVYNEIQGKPDMLGGASVSGSLYFLAAADDSDLVILWDGDEFIVPLAA
jgi:hypothetical protein